MKTTKSTKKNLAIPGEPLTQEEFEAIIQETENGAFKSVKNLKEDVLLLWKKKYGK